MVKKNQKKIRIEPQLAAWLHPLTYVTDYRLWQTRGIIILLIKLWSQDK